MCSGPVAALGNCRARVMLPLSITRLSSGESVAQVHRSTLKAKLACGERCRGLFFAIGLLGFLVHIWDISADLRARRNWPIAHGEIVSAKQRDDSAISLKARSMSSRTRYWVEYEVSFVLPEDRCRNAISDTSENGVSCRGIVRRRSTQSAHECCQWLTRGYHPDEPVQVLYNRNGADIKIAGESIWLRFNFDQLTVNVLWLLAFGVLYHFSQHRLHHFQNHLH
jgi:hypothetical protein